jgi:hypothetical protein
MVVGSHYHPTIVMRGRDPRILWPEMAGSSQIKSGHDAERLEMRPELP